MTGSFFEGIPGIQFASPAALRTLRGPLDEDAVYWMNATDPASLCGINLPTLKGMLPKRVAGTHLVYRGAKLVLASRRSGKDLDIHVPPDDPCLPDYFAFMRNMLERRFEPVRGVRIQVINGKQAIATPYDTWLREFFDISTDSKQINVWKQTGR